MDLKISSLLTSSAGIFRLLVGVVSAPLLVRALGLHDYGLWNVAASITIICLLMDFGVNTALVTYLAADVARDDFDRGRRTLSTSLLLVTAFGCITLAVLLISVPWIEEVLFSNPDDRIQGTPVLTVLCFSVPLKLWQAWAAGVEAGLQRYDWQTAVELPSSLAIQIGSVLTASLGGGVMGIAVVQSAIIGLTCATHFAVLFKILPAGLRAPSFSLSAARDLIRFGSASWLTSIGITLFNQGDRLIVNSALGPTATGVYTAVTSVAGKIVEMTVLPLRVLPPAVSAAYSINDQGRVRKLFAEAARVNGAITWVCAAGLIFFAEPLMRIVLGHTYVPVAATALRVAAFIYGLNSISIYAGWFAMGINRPSILAKWTLPGTALMCVAMYFMSRQLGIMGAVWSNAGYLLTAGMTVQISRFIGLPLVTAIAVFLSPVAALLGAFLLTSLAVYEGLPFLVQCLAFVIVVPVVVLCLITLRRVNQALVQLIGRLPVSRPTKLWLRGFVDRLIVHQTNFENFLHHLQEDWIAHRGRVMTPGFHAIVWHRFGTWASEVHRFVRPLALPVYELGHIFLRKAYRINLYRTTYVGRRVVFAGASNITIHRESVLGDDCVIRENVVIGVATADDGTGPILEPGVAVGEGALIIGPVKIGEEAKIGPNAVVTSDIPAGGTAMAPPTRIQERRSAGTTRADSDGDRQSLTTAAPEFDE